MPAPQGGKVYIRVSSFTLLTSVDNSLLTLPDPDTECIRPEDQEAPLPPVTSAFVPPPPPAPEDGQCPDL